MCAVTHEGDYPPQALKLPRVVHSAFEPRKLTSAEIDNIVTQRMAEGKGIYEIDLDVLRAADPDLLITQDLCPE